MKRTIIACSLAVGMISTTYAASPENGISTWKNSHGSVLTLQVLDKNALSGTFTTAIATKQCPKAVGMKRNITGFIVKNAITVSVSYPDCGTVLTFIGNIDKQNGTLEATSILAQQADQIFAQRNSVQLITHDSFKRA